MAETYYAKPENSPVNDLTLNSYDALIVASGGSANGTVINTLGSAVINDGGSANATTVNGSGTLTLLGGQAAGVTVASDGRLETNKGTTVTGIEAAKGAILALTVAPDTEAAGTSAGVAFQIHNGLATGFALETGVLTVSGGATAINTTLNSAGFLNVSDGGKATGATVNTSGTLRIYSGGSAVGATVSMGGKLTVESGGLADAAVVAFGGTIEVVSSAGLATGTVVSGGLTLSKGGKATGTTVAAGGVLNVGTKGVAEGADVNGFLNVLEGGLASNVTLNEGAAAYVQSKGTATDIAVEDGAFLEVLAEGRLKGATVSHGGSATIHADVMASNVVVDGGIVTIKSDGWAAQTGVSGNTIVENGGLLEVEGGAHVEGAYVSAGGHVDVLSDGSFASALITNADVSAYKGAFVSRMNLAQGGVLRIESGASAQHLNVSEGGILTGILREASEIRFYGGTVDLDISTAAPGNEFIIDDYSFSNFVTTEVYTYLCTLTVAGTQADGTYKLIEAAGGFDKTITVQDTTGKSLGTLTVGGETTIGDKKYTLAIDANGLTLTIAPPGSPVDLTGDLTSSYDLKSGKVASSVNLLYGGKLLVYDGAVTSQTDVRSGGEMHVYAGAKTNETTVNYGGALYLYHSGSATKVMENGGNVEAYVGSIVEFVPHEFTGLTVKDWNSATIHSGTTGTDLTAENGGGIEVHSGGIAHNITIGADGVLNLMEGGTASGTTVASGGQIQISGVADVVALEGKMYVSAGGKASNVTINGKGSAVVSGGGSADVVTVNSGGVFNVRSSGAVNGVTVSGGDLYVSAGGTATNIAWTPCEGFVYVGNGASATFVSTYTGVYYGSDNKLLESAASMDGKTLDDNCIMYVMDGGLVTNTTVDGHGSVEIWSGGKAANATLNYGWIAVSSGGVAAGITVNGTGSVEVSGGVIDGAVFKTGCGLAVYDKSKLTGRITFENGIFVENYGDLILDFDLTQTEPGAATLVNGLSFLPGGASAFTLTVSGTDAAGDYKLAEGAAGFDKTITVKNTSGVELGTLTVAGGKTTIDGRDYTLTLNGGSLGLTLGAGGGSPDTTPPDKPIPEASSELPTNGYVTVTATFSDDSVLRECSKDGENWVEYQSSGLTFVENGKAYFRATDGAGNVSDIAVYEVTNIDKVAPTISYITASTTAPAASVTVTASFDDDVSLASTQYRIGDSAWQDYTTGVTVTENTTVYFKAVDAAGNETTDSYEVTNITGGGSVDLTGDLSDSYELTAGKVASSVNILNGGTLEVMNGGVASQTTVNSNGDLAVSEGGVADVVTVNFGGDLYVRNGGVATLVKENGGYVGVNDGADVTFVSNTFAGYAYDNSADFATLHSGTTGTDLSASNEGNIDIFSGGIAQNVTIGNNGHLNVHAGGKVTGKMTFETGAIVEANTGAILDFDLTQTTAGADALVNDLSFALAQPFTYTLTVDGTQTGGTYNLGGNATGFSKAISVRNTSGVDYGYLTFGGTLSTAFADFTLNLTSDDTLTVNVAAKGGSDTTPPVITITPSTTELAKSVTMTAEFTDNVAVATRQYRIGDGAWLNYEAPFIVTENAVIGFRATDTSGNTTVESYEVQNIQPDAKNEPDNGWNDYLYDKKKGWNKEENVSQFASNTITGNGEIHLDPAGLIDLEGMHNMFGNDGINVDAGDVGKIAVTTAAKLSFSVKSTADGTFFIYQDGFDKKGNRAQLTVGKVTVKKGKVATLSGICLATDGQYYAAMTAKNVKKPGPSGIYNVTVVDSTIFVDADDGWNNAALNKAVVDNPFKIERGVKTVKLDSADMIDGGDFNNFVGFSDPVDYAKLNLSSTAYLSFDVGTNGSAKFTLWKRDTGTGKLTKVGGVTSLKSKKGELVTKSTKAQLLEVGDKYDYFVSMECTDAGKGGSAYYNVNVNTVATRFFDSSDGGENNWLFDKKNKAYNDDANLRVNTLSSFEEKALYLDNTSSGDPAFNNFVGFKDSADYAKVVLTKGGSLSFKITALADVSFEIWRKSEDKKGNPALTSLQKKTDVKVKDYSVGASAKTDVLTLEAGEYYISVTAKSTKSNEKGSAFYNVTALFGSSEAGALAMPETSDALAMTDSLSFGGYGADALADVSAASLAEFDGQSGWRNLASLA